jgi:hypothetical protein
MNLRQAAPWFGKLIRRRRLSGVTEVASMNDVYEKLGAKIYIVRRGGRERRAVLACPCRCGTRIDVSLMASHNPHWTVEIRDGRISLYPSIWLLQDPCQSHFLIRRNRFIWV